jgi:hypothetical protein
LNDGETRFDFHFSTSFLPSYHPVYMKENVWSPYCYTK